MIKKNILFFWCILFAHAFLNATAIINNKTGSKIKVELIYENRVKGASYKCSEESREKIINPNEKESFIPVVGSCTIKEMMVTAIDGPATGATLKKDIDLILPLIIEISSKNRTLIIDIKKHKNS